MEENIRAGLSSVLVRFSGTGTCIRHYPSCRPTHSDPDRTFMVGAGDRRRRRETETKVGM